MKKLLVLFFIFSIASVYGESFIVEISNHSLRVSSPERVLDPVSVVVKNMTTIKIHAELRSTDKVLSRFVVDANDSNTLQVKLPKNKKLYYLTVSPPSQAVELKFNQRTYEIPEKE